MKSLLNMKRNQLLEIIFNVCRNTDFPDFGEVTIYTTQEIKDLSTQDLREIINHNVIVTYMGRVFCFSS
jgi:hypothetical protein